MCGFAGFLSRTDMGATDENLWHGTALGAFHHGGALLGVEINADFLDVGYAFGGQNPFGLHAIRANASGVHGDSLHHGILYSIFL